MRFWLFYGTLMDREVREIVLDRPGDVDELTPARLMGYARRRALDEHYPVLVPTAGGCVAGLVCRLSAEDERRVRYFEGEEYRPRHRLVQLAGGERLPARVWLPQAGFRASGERWEIESWVAVHKAEFLTLARQWMAGFGHLGFAEADAAWDLARGIGAHPELRRRSGG